MAERERRAGDEARAVVSYADGTWTDRLLARCLTIDTGGGSIRLVLEMLPRRHKARPARLDALQGFVAKRSGIESVMLIRPSFRAKLKERLLHAENAELSVMLCALGADVVYPACAVLGPEGITLTLG